MIAARGVTVMELDARASEAYRPYGVITADCTGAHEFDDAISVTPLPSATELYRVMVCSVDTSHYYDDERILRDALRRTESVYNNRNTGDEQYEPMLPDAITQSMHFSANIEGAQKALMVSFLIGEGHPPSDVAIDFGRVEVTKNYTYKQFGEKCRYRKDMEGYGRAAALILHHLKTVEAEPDIAHRGLIHVPASETYRRGANINQAFMVAANYLVGKQRSEQGLPAIYRTHDTTSDAFAEFLPPRVAHYSMKPGEHKGLGLDVYCRVTSPLRRLEDFIMLGLLKATFRGRELTLRDHKNQAAAVQRLNQRIVSELFNGTLRLREDDLWVPTNPQYN